MTPTCPFCSSSLRHSWLPDSWYECGTKVGTRTTDRGHQTFGCLKVERERLSAALEKAQAKIRLLMGVVEVAVPCCEYLHHKKAHQHKLGEPCQVEALVRKAKGANA